MNNIVYDNTFDARLTAHHLLSEGDIMSPYSPSLDIEGDELIIIGSIPQRDTDNLSAKHRITEEWTKKYKAQQYTKIKHVKKTFIEHYYDSIGDGCVGVDLVNKYYDENEHNSEASMFKTKMSILLDDIENGSIYSGFLETEMTCGQCKEDNDLFLTIKRSANADYFYCISMGKRAVVLNTSFQEYFMVEDLMNEHKNIDLFITYNRMSLEKTRVKFFHRHKPIGERMAKLHRTPTSYVYEHSEVIVRDIDYVVK